jgi:hypothetical protein
MHPVPMLSIDKGEEIVHALISSYLPGTGFYKLLSKQKADKSFTWVHFVERVNGKKENVYSGDVKTLDELLKVIEIMNRILTRTFGTFAEMKPGKTEVKTTMGMKDNGTIN